MPVAHFVNNCLHLPQGQDCQYLLPLAPGQTPENVNLARFNPGFLIPAPRGSNGHVVGYSFNGAMRVHRTGEKKQIGADEAGWLMNRVPGLINIVDDGEDGNQTVSVLVEREEKLRRELSQETSRANTAEDNVRALKSAGLIGDVQIQKLVFEREGYYNEVQSLGQKLALLEQENRGLRNTDNGLLRLQFSAQTARIEALEATMTPAAIANVSAALAGRPATVTEDPDVLALRARSDEPSPGDASEADLTAAEIDRMNVAVDKQPQRPDDSKGKSKGK